MAGFNSQFNLATPYNPAAQQNLTPGMLKLLGQVQANQPTALQQAAVQPMGNVNPMGVSPTPQGGAGPGGPTNGAPIQSGGAMPGNPGAPTPGLLDPNTAYAGPGAMPTPDQQSTQWAGQGSPMAQLPGQGGMASQIPGLLSMAAQAQQQGAPQPGQVPMAQMHPAQRAGGNSELQQLLGKYGISSGLLGGE